MGKVILKDINNGYINLYYDEDIQNEKEVIIDDGILQLTLEKPQEKIIDALSSYGFKYVGNFLYDFNTPNPKWNERIRTQLFEKNGQLWYFMGVTEWDENKIKTVKIGSVEIQKNNNPEYRFH